MEKFVPRPISRDAAAQGYNNRGRGELIGYIAQPDAHESGCPYRENPKSAVCACRIGLWQKKPKVIAKRPNSSKAKKARKRK